MKHFKLILTIIVAAASAFSFTKCTEDETVEAPTKTEILKAKAKELSTKYGIDVTLNEENLESVADTLTPEQMEKDFQLFAALKDAPIVGESEPKKKPQRNRLRIKMNKTIEEERDVDYSGSKENIRLTCNAIIRKNRRKWSTEQYIGQPDRHGQRLLAVCLEEGRMGKTVGLPDNIRRNGIRGQCHV